jgi:hypothetical protein
MEKRIILEDTGERRYPQGNELYVYFNPEDTAHPSVHNCEEYNEGGWGGCPQDFAILRVVANDFVPEPKPYTVLISTNHNVLAVSVEDAKVQAFRDLAQMTPEALRDYCNAEVHGEEA